VKLKSNFLQQILRSAPMKTFFVTLAAFSLTLFFACQENSITDPVINDTGMQHSTPMENTLDKDALSYYTGAIKLEGILLDPSHHFNAYAEINGIHDIVWSIFTLEQGPHIRVLKLVYM
jgi:hypothetical protein